MNLHITDSSEKVIENYININISEKEQMENLSKLPLSSCEHVHVSEVLQLLPYQDSISLCAMAISKVRLGGRITMSIVDFDSVSVAYINGGINDEQLSKILSKTESVIPSSLVLDNLAKSQITVESIEKRDFFFNITGTRMGNE